MQGGNEPAVGIDLGTTFSVVAHLDAQLDRPTDSAAAPQLPPVIGVGAPGMVDRAGSGVVGLYGAVLPFHVALPFPVGCVDAAGAGGALLGALDKSGVVHVYCAPVLPRGVVVLDREAG